MMTLNTGLSSNALSIFKKKQTYAYDNVIMTYTMKTIAYSFCGKMNTLYKIWITYVVALKLWNYFPVATWTWW